jgi:F420-0:gamma-glutamyl ligase
VETVLKAGLVMAATLSLVIAEPAIAGTYKRIGSESASGDFAIAIASGTAKKPKAIYVAVIAKPRQQVSVNWTLVCSKGAGAGSKSGGYDTSSSTKRKLRLPMSNSDSCSVSASGSLARGGKITVRLYQR